MSLSTPVYLKDLGLSGDAKSIDQIREEFKKYGIKVSYSPDEKDRRVIFSATKQQRHSPKFDAFVAECNGLVLRSDTWQPLVIPPKTFKSNVDADVINVGIARNEYDILEAVDGTMISLYFYSNSWRISTAKGFDVTRLKWNGIAYNQVLKEVLRACHIDVAKFYESLDKAQCYTFCFTHPVFHPFWKTRDDNMKIVFVQSANLTTWQSSTKNPFDSIPSQTKLGKVKNIRELFRELPKTLDNYVKTGAINFGYILRLKDDADGASPEQITYSNVFLESRLLQTIRHMYYDGRHNIAARAKKYDLETYIVVNAFLDRQINVRFLQLFPQYTSHFRDLEAISVKLVSSMLDMIAEDRKEDPPDAQDFERASAGFLINELGKVYTVDVKSRDSTRTVSSFVLNKDYVDIFYRLYTDRAEPEPCISTPVAKEAAASASK